jgi:hypothetical protein
MNKNEQIARDLTIAWIGKQQNATKSEDVGAAYTAILKAVSGAPQTEPAPTPDR